MADLGGNKVRGNFLGSHEWGHAIKGILNFAYSLAIERYSQSNCIR